MRNPIPSRPRPLSTAVISSFLLAAATASGAAADPGLSVGPLLGAPTEEGDAATITVRLDAPAASPVTLLVTASGPGAVTLEPDIVSFAPGEWLVPRTIRIVGVDDEVDDAISKSVVVQIAVAPGSDPAYLGLPPIQRTAAVLDDEETLLIESAPIVCLGPATEDIYAGTVTSTRYERGRPAADGPEFDPDDPAQDDVDFPEHSDERQVALRTLHVILRNTLDVTMTDQGIADLSRRYTTAAHQIHVAAGGLLRLEHQQVVLDDWFGAWAFGHPHGSERGAFTAYHALEWSLLLAGYDVDDFDVVNVSVAVAQEAVAPVAPLGGYARAYAVVSDPGPTFGNSATWGNGRTWTTIQFASGPTAPDWRDVFMHEMNHSVEWMLEYGAYRQHRNADDPWWLATYPLYAPGSTGFGKIDVLTMFWARPKTFYDLLTDQWGELRTQTPSHVVETSCADEHTLKLRRQHCAQGVACDDQPWINQLPGSRCHCLEPRGGEPGTGGGR